MHEKRCHAPAEKMQGATPGEQARQSGRYVIGLEPCRAGWGRVFLSVDVDGVIEWCKLLPARDVAESIKGSESCSQKIPLISDLHGSPSVEARL